MSVLATSVPSPAAASVARYARDACGRCRSAASSTGTRRPSGSIRAAGRASPDARGRRPRRRRRRGVVGLAAAGRAPIRPSKKGMPGSTSAAEPMPTNPPPPRTNCSSAASCIVPSRSPGVLRNTTARYVARLSAVNALESAVSSTVNPCALPSPSIAATPASVVGSDAPWNTSTLISGACACAGADTSSARPQNTASSPTARTNRRASCIRLSSSRKDPCRALSRTRHRKIQPCADPSRTFVRSSAKGLLRPPIALAEQHGDRGHEEDAHEERVDQQAEATVKPTWNSASIGIAISVANVPARISPALVITPPVRSRPAITASRVGSAACSSRIRPIRKMLSSTPSATRKMNAKSGSAGSAVAEHVRARRRARTRTTARRSRSRRAARPRAQQRRDDQQDQHEHERHDQLRVGLQRLLVVVLLGGHAADQRGAVRRRALRAWPRRPGIASIAALGERVDLRAGPRRASAAGRSRG